MVLTALKKHFRFIISIFKGSRLLQNAKKGSTTIFADLEAWQMKATCKDQLLLHWSITPKTNGILKYISVKISKLSNVLTQGLQQEFEYQGNMQNDILA